MDLRKTCEAESLRINTYDKLLQRINSLFVDTLSNHTKVFTSSQEPRSPTTEGEADLVKRKNEFAKRYITGFPISWLNLHMEEKNFKSQIERLLQKDISSPFYDM